MRRVVVPPKQGNRFLPIHGHAIHGRPSPEYVSWVHLKARCLNPADSDYPAYGGRGIEVCERWIEFVNFFEDMGPKPTPKHSLDRIDNDGNYEPGNCRWATKREQCLNQRDNVRYTLNGETLALSEWAERTGCNHQTIQDRIAHGWPLELALTAPPDVLRSKALIRQWREAGLAAA